MSGVVVGVGEKVDVHVERDHLDTAFLLTLEGEAGVEADSPNPSLHVAFALESVETSPQVDERFLEQVVHLVVVLREQVTNGVDGVFVPLHDVGKLVFFLLHGY